MLVLTHDFHHSVPEEGSAALQVAESFDVQQPDVGSGVTVGHPLCQVPADQTPNKDHPRGCLHYSANDFNIKLLLTNDLDPSSYPCNQMDDKMKSSLQNCSTNRERRSYLLYSKLTCQLLQRRSDLTSSFLPAHSSRTPPGSRPSGSACQE